MVRQAFLWSLAGQFVTFAVQFGSSLIIARLLTPLQLGVYAVALAVTGVIQVIGGFSVGVFVLRAERLDESMLATAFTINVILSSVLAAIILATSFLGASYFGSADVPRLLKLLAIVPLLGVISFRPAILLQRKLQVRGLTIVGIASSLLSSISTVLCALYGFGSISLAYGSLAGAVFGTIGSMWLGRGSNRFAMSLVGWRPMTSFGLRLMSIGGVGAAAARACDVVTAHYLGLTALGLYSRASNLNNMLFTNIYGAATRVVFTKLSEAKRTGARDGEVYLRGFRLITAVMAPLFLGIAVLSGPVIRILYGPKWFGASLPLSLIMIGSFIGLCCSMNWEMFVLHDEMKLQTKLELTRSASNVFVRTIAAQINLAAVAASSIIDAIVSVLLYQKHMPRLARIDSFAFHRAYIELFALSTVAVAPSAALMMFEGWASTTSILLIIVAVLLGAILWFALLIRLRHPVCAEVATMLRTLGLREPNMLSRMLTV